MFSASQYDPHNSTFQTLVRAVARVMEIGEEEARVHAERVWAFVHGLVSLELGGLRPGAEEDPELAYTDALQAGLAIILLRSAN